MPILVGCVNCLNRRSGLIYLITSLALSVVCCFSIYIAFYVFSYGDIHYYFGGWLPPVGIAFKITKLKSIFAILISSIALLNFLQGKSILFNELSDARIPGFCGVFLICVAGFLGVVSTNDFFNLYVFIEIASLTSYALVSISSNRDSFKAAFNYLVIGTIAATFILLGIGYLYSASGTLNIDDFITKMPGLVNSKLIKLGYYLLMTGLLIKSGLFPLHTWFVDSYKASSSFVLPFLGAVSSKTYILLIIILNYVVFGQDYVSNNTRINLMLIIMGAVASLIAAISALREKNLRNMLVFSSISQIGYIFIAIGLGNRVGVIVAVIFLISNIFAKASLFILTSHIFLLNKSYIIEKLDHLKERMPITVALFMINAASIIGIPVTMGFLAKMGLIVGLIQEGRFFILCLIVFSSLISLLYIWKFLEYFLYTKKGSKDIESPRFNENKVSIFVVVLLSSVNLLCGVFFEEFFVFLNNMIF